ncbi:MAG: hypothetical protein OXI11_09790 [Gammaproteobacteria bacterium]|nr:hypothetical protein [Gammaproteobacteria bacterium]MXW46186.1 hypothetical protein [Gammaproteobacteria bacterium]MYD01708.1 hypothetical protein [Gammaproteobacteria bacterium]MYI26441.1 hypothetical protein [Gammaproteobacteria bacterium]
MFPLKLPLVASVSGAEFDDDRSMAMKTARRLVAFNTESGSNIDSRTARCKWSGERLDYNIAINGLCGQTGYS